jgi:hypothetical protein
MIILGLPASPRIVWYQTLGAHAGAGPSCRAAKCRLYILADGQPVSVADLIDHQRSLRRSLSHGADLGLSPSCRAASVDSTSSPMTSLP